VANIVEDLIGAGLVREAGRRKSPGSAANRRQIAGTAAAPGSGSTRPTSGRRCGLGGALIEMPEGPARGTDRGWIGSLPIFSRFRRPFRRRAMRRLGLVTPGPFRHRLARRSDARAVPAL
jgi:hypothetical protein